MSSKTVRLLDRLTIEHFGISGLILMENAGTGCTRLILEAISKQRGKPPVLVMAGPGNNGGDGFVIARQLHNRGIPVTVALTCKREAFRSGTDGAHNLQALAPTGVPVLEAQTMTPGLSKTLDDAGLIVDALFGTGLDRPLNPHFQAIIEAVNQSRTPVLAVDIPSGLDAETGRSWGACIQATLTATFAAAKNGLVRGDGPGACGDIHVVSISIPRHLIQEALDSESAFAEKARGLLLKNGSI